MPIKHSASDGWSPLSADARRCAHTRRGRGPAQAAAPLACTFASSCSAGLAISWLVNRDVENRRPDGREPGPRVAVTNCAATFGQPIRRAGLTRPPQTRSTRSSAAASCAGVVGGGSSPRRNGHLLGATSGFGRQSSTRRSSRGAEGRRHERVTYTDTWPARSTEVLQILVPVRATLTAKPIGVIGARPGLRARRRRTGDTPRPARGDPAIALLAPS